MEINIIGKNAEAVRAVTHKVAERLPAICVEEHGGIWLAYEGKTPIGRGNTEEDAVQDLLTQLINHDIVNQFK